LLLPIIDNKTIKLYNNKDKTIVFGGKFMEWYHILLIALGSIIVIGTIVFLILYLSSKSLKEKSLGQAKGLYKKIIDTFGGIDNISEVNVNGSRLSISLKDTSYINSDTLQIMTNEGFGVVKTSKKITLVIGEMAVHYYKAIQKELEK
jgi:phosphotransferase system IIB component